jgi:hypothetical protein
MTSPRFNEELNVKYILVKTDYNNRALTDKKCCRIISATMGDFEDYVDDGNDNYFPDSDKFRKIVENKSIYYIPSPGKIRLLYTVHSGYTWIDEEELNEEEGGIKVYPNRSLGDEEDDYTIVRQLFKDNDVNDEGCFVFELIEPTLLMFRDIMFNFIMPLTKMEFCGHFYIETLSDVEYNENCQAITFRFDTESG